MSKAHLSTAAVIAIIAIAAAAAVITIELGLAFQSETDSGGTVKTGNYIEAFSSNGTMVTLTPVRYVQSEDKETYDLANTEVVNRGYMNVGTKDDAVKDMVAMITFQEPGTWLLVETMNLTLQRETGFLILVGPGVSVTGTTVITISSTGVPNIISSATVLGNWKAWGYGSNVHDYVVADHQADASGGFIVLVDSSFTLTHHLNVLKITAGSSANNVSLDTSADTISNINLDGIVWKLWNTATEVSSPAQIPSSSLLLKYGDEINRKIYNSADKNVAGEPTEKMDVLTGRYNFTIVADYKPQIRMDPQDFHGDNMRSNVVFILSDKPAP